MKLGRLRIIGDERCPHVNRKTGQTCNRLGRYNPKVRVTWNTKLIFDQHRKRQYRQFIHNDGTRHYTGSVSNPAESRLDNTIKKAALTTNWLLNKTPAEFDYITSQFKAGNKYPLVESFRLYDARRRRDIMKGSEDSERQKWWYRRGPLYEATKELIQFELEMLSKTDFRPDFSRLLSSEMATRLAEERRAALKSQALYLRDIRN